MQIVIDIAQNEYDALEKLDAKYLLHIIKDGTPLPKGHGRLIDADALDDNCDWYHTDDDGSWCYKCKDIDNAPTIVEANKEVDE